MSAWAPDPISDQELAALGEQMRCDFTGHARRGFLNRWDSCDVQAAPGSGKTTLVVAKLVHLSRHWPFARRGVCVLSHTNVAREEIEEKIASIPDGGRVLAYPSFIGTLTSFFHNVAHAQGGCCRPLRRIMPSRRSMTTTLSRWRPCPR